MSHLSLSVPAGMGKHRHTNTPALAPMHILCLSNHAYLCLSENSVFSSWHSSKLLIVPFVLCRMVVEPSLQDESEFLYAAQPELLRYRTPQLTVEKVMDWYQTRAEEIEHYARQVREEWQLLLSDAGSATLGS